MESSSKTFQQIMDSSRKYIVPPFQRDYSWESEQWEDLWDDIESLKEEKNHYMGYVVIQTQNTSDGKKIFKIIDGQQRLTTISIIILAALKRIQDNILEDNQIRMGLIRSKYVGTMDTVSLNSYNRLTLNRNNDSTFRMLSALQEPSIRKIKKTNKTMLDAYLFFYKKIGQRSGKELAEFVENMTEGLLFTEITVNNDLNAYNVFETLNARGVQLSTPDLLKNYLFSLIHKETASADDDEMEQLDIKWETIVLQLGKVNFSDFIRTDFNAEYAHSTKNELFRKIRKKIISRESAYDYFHRLEKRVAVFAALFSNEDEFWIAKDDGKYKDVQKGLYALQTFNITQPYTILLTAFFKFSPEEFCKLVNYLVILSIRYNVVCKRSPNEQERIYGNIARKITLGDFTRASKVKNSDDFKSLYPSDDEFMHDFKIKKLLYNNSNGKKIKYLLGVLERKLGNTALEPISNNSNVTIEHILPQNPTESWKKIFEDYADESIDMLGNIVLIDKQSNSNCGTKDFDTKKTFFENSGYYIAKKISEYEIWDREKLIDHQNWLAQIAVGTWKIDYNKEEK
jgi:uncharacterized protein with ParB-like and HNH nuclease domain